MKFVKAIAALSVIMLMLSAVFVQQANSQPHDRNLGLGVVAGEPTGLSAKLWLSQLDAFAGGAAWSFRGNTTMHLHVDYIRHNFEAIQVNRGTMAFYYGLGGRLLMGNDDRVGIRVPFGLAYFFENDPLEIFLEIAPILDVAPATEFTGNSGLGIRYYF